MIVFVPIMFCQAISSPSRILQISILADEPEPSQRSYPELRAVWGLHSSDQILVSRPLAGRAVNEAVDPLRGVPLDIAFIQAEGKLIDIAVHVLRADMVERAINAPLENGKETFDTIGRHVIADELARAVVDRLMGKPSEIAVGRELVGMDSRTEVNMLSDFITDHVAVCRAPSS
jgi:hypothetical protein